MLLVCMPAFAGVADMPAITPDIAWQIAGTLSPEVGQTLPLGLGGPVVGVSNEQLLVGGGANFPDQAPWRGGHKVFYRRICAYAIHDDTLGPAHACTQLPQKLAYSANVSTPDGMVVVGGENARGPVADVLLIDWNAAAGRIDIHHLANLPHALGEGMAAVADGTVYFAGGADQHATSDELYALHLRGADAWHRLGKMPEPVRDGVLLAADGPNGRALYLVGGRRSMPSGVSQLYASVYRYDLAHGAWSRCASLPYALSAQTGVTWNDHTLLIFSGDRGRAFHSTQELTARWRAAKDPEAKNRLRVQLMLIQEMHPGYSRAVLRYDTRRDEWARAGTLPFYGQVTTTAVQSGRRVWIASGEIRAGVRTPHVIVGTAKP